jgi:hypothetical protein
VSTFALPVGRDITKLSPATLQVVTSDTASYL